MGTWEERMTPRPPREPRLELLEVCWRVVGPSQKVLECGLYRTDVGLEVRCGYRVDDLIRSEVAREIDQARAIAEAWKAAAVAKGFQEVTD